jgi:hypothetical protein
VPIRHSLNTTIRLGRRHRKDATAWEAALGKLGLVDCDDPPTMAVAKLIIELAKQGERDPERLCAAALQQLSK